MYEVTNPPPEAPPVGSEGTVEPVNKLHLSDLA